MYGSFEVQKMRKNRSKDKDETEVRRDPKRDKSKNKTYDFQRNQKRQSFEDNE